MRARQDGFVAKAEYITKDSGEHVAPSMTSKVVESIREKWTDATAKDNLLVPDILTSEAGRQLSAASAELHVALDHIQIALASVQTASATATSAAGTVLPSNNIERSSRRKVGDVLFAASFPADVLSILTTTTPQTASEGCSASAAISGLHGSPAPPTPLSGAQTISVNAKTGGKKRSKPLRYDLLPVGPMAEVALLYGLGAKLYAPRNWELGYDWSLSYAAMQRHLACFWAGEDWDHDGFHHLAAVVFHALALMEYGRTHPECDDRSLSFTQTPELPLDVPNDFEPDEEPFV